MTKDQLKRWRHFCGISQTTAAEAMGVCRRTYQAMERGTAEIRKGHELACAAWAMGIRDYNGPEEMA